MNPKVIGVLQKIFWFFGWLILVSAIVGIGFQGYEYFFPSEGYYPEQQFVFLKNMKIVFEAIADAFFAFLVSAIFDMAFRRSHTKTQRTESFLKLTCIGFVGQGIFGLGLWIQSMFRMQFHLTGSTQDILLFISYSTSLLPSLMSFVYSISIYILYRHFYEMVVFESEVV